MTTTHTAPAVKGAILKPGSPEWLRTMTGSKAAAALNLNPYHSPYELWRVMTGREPGFAGSPRTLIGHHLEPEILEAYGRKHGIQLTGYQEEFRHPDHEWLVVHIDARRPDANVAVEAKSVAEHAEECAPGEQPRWFKPRTWGPNGSDQVPEYHLVQEVLQMACGGFDRVDLHAQFIRWDPKDCTGILTDAWTYHLHRNPALESRVIGKLQEFMWYVKNDKPPAPRSATEATLREPVTPTKAVELTEAMERELTAFNALQRSRKPLQEQADELKAEADEARFRLYELVGDAELLVGADGAPLVRFADTKKGYRMMYPTAAGSALGVVA